MKDPLYIIDGTRTPFSKMGTTFNDIGAVELGRSAVAHLMSSTGIDPNIIDETIMGCVGQPADAANVSRVIALRAGIPESVPAITVHRNCASGMEAITQAAEKADAGRGEVFLVGGAESMSAFPLFFKHSTKKKFEALMRSKTLMQKLGAMAAFRPHDFSPRIGLKLGLTDPICGLNMGQTAEILARDFNLSRDAQDAFALASHEKAAQSRDKFKEEICPVYIDKSRSSVVEYDNGPRENQSLKALKKLRPVFEKGGTVTAGNASQVTDGAVALIVATESACKKHGLHPIGKLTAYAYAGCEPKRMGLGPVYAMAKLQEQTGLTISDADIIEINEAFAAQVMGVSSAAASKAYCKEHLGLDKPLGDIAEEKLNVNGGAIAIGHPVGATGARLVLSSLKELHRRKAKRALVTLCIGGGQGGALWIETL